MKRLPVLALALVAAVPACNVESGAGSSPFEKLNHQQALAKAKSEKKVVLIVFYSDSCVYCDRLDAETFTDGRVRALLKERAVALRVKIEANQQLAQMYRVAGTPCLVFVNGEGDEVGRIPGFVRPEMFLAAVRRIVS
jgi:thioredoxin-related protein